MFSIKTQAQLADMKKAGNISTQTLREVLKHVKVGVTTLELDQIAEKTMISLGGKPGFKTVDDYPFATCININEGIVHGMPGDYRLKQGDIISIDLGAMYNGMHSDLTYTIELDTKNEEKFLNVGKRALDSAIAQCKSGNTIGDIGQAMQYVIEQAGYSVSRDLVGHGVGTELHEDPYVPCYGKKGKGLVLKEGMVLAIEAIYQKGKPHITTLEDDWTIITVDRSLSAVYEKTVAITKDGHEVLTEF